MTREKRADAGQHVIGSTPDPGRAGGKGISLLELMIATVVIAVLAALAMSAYQHYVLRARYFQAEEDIATMSGSIKVFFQDARAYPNSLADVQLAAKLDPWGRPYVYYNILANGKGHARKDHALNPINSDFDLYSLGPDGLSKLQITQKESLDDVIRANDGNFVGVAADF